MIMCVLLCYPVSIRIYYQQGVLFLVFTLFQEREDIIKVNFLLLSSNLRVKTETGLICNLFFGIGQRKYPCLVFAIDTMPTDL